MTYAQVTHLTVLLNVRHFMAVNKRKYSKYMARMLDSLNIAAFAVRINELNTIRHRVLKSLWDEN